MKGKGVTNGDKFIERALSTILDFTADDAQQLAYRKFIAPANTTVHYAKALNRSVTGSMNDHIHGAKLFLADGMAPSEIGYRLNKTPMSALTNADGRKYGYPREVFKLLSSKGN
jgi:hypothetical protein